MGSMGSFDIIVVLKYGLQWVHNLQKHLDEYV